MSKLGKASFTDKREKPITVKATKNKNKDISFEPTTEVMFKKGGGVGLYANINRRKKLGISRPKSKSTISKKSYSNMEKGFPKAKGGIVSRGQGKIIKTKTTKYC